jgi:hypothetical protein
MAANNTYVDKNGDRRWRKDAICPALGGEKTCGQHLQDGVVFELAYARKIARAKKRKGTKVNPPNVPIGCRGYLYSQDSPTFMCEKCGRNVPWSVGGNDDLCDICWAKENERAEEE